MKAFTLKITLALLVFAILTGPLHAGDGWTTDYKKAMEQAKAEKKFVLIDFNGVPWCKPCVLLEREVFSSSKFLEYAEKKFVLININFPTPYSEPTTGVELAEKYLGAEILLPTVVVLAPDGRKLGQLGYEPGGPDVFIAKVEKLVKS